MQIWDYRDTVLFRRPNIGAMMASPKFIKDNSFDMDIRLPFVLLILLTFCTFSGPALSEESETLQLEVEKLKSDLIDLNRELYQFEEALLYPTETQLAVFLSISNESTFNLDSVELRLDNRVISSHLYKGNELSALKKGGTQRLYIGSLSDGKHKLTAQFNGQGTSSRYFRRNKALRFTKEAKAKYIQLVVAEDSKTREPIFKVKQW